MSMVSHIFLYRLTCHFVSNGSDKISIFPKFSASQLFFDLWMSQKDLFCTHTFENSHHISNRILRWYRCKYMDMIFCLVISVSLQTILLHYFSEHLSVSICDTFVPTQDDILCRKLHGSFV